VDYYVKKGVDRQDRCGDEIAESPRNRVDDLTDTLTDSHAFKTMQDTQEIYCYHDDRGIFVKDGVSIIQVQVESIYPNIS